MAPQGRLRQRVRAWADSADQHAADMRRAHESTQTVTVAAAPRRELVHLRGTLRTVTLRPRGGVPALEAELYDGTGVVTLTWLGRRRISGIVPGRSIQVHGRIATIERTATMFNPRYELMP